MNRLSRWLWGILSAIQLGAISHDFVTHRYIVSWTIFDAAIFGFGIWYTVYGYRWPGWDQWRGKV